VNIRACLFGLIVLLAFTALGCEPKVTSPFTGKPATGAEITYQRDAAIEKAKADSDAQIQSATPAANATPRQPPATPNKAQREFQNAVAKMDAESAAAVAKLNSEFESTLDDLNAKLEVTLATQRGRMNDAVTAAKLQVTSFNGKADAAFADIEHQKAVISGLAGLVQFIPGATAVPGLGQGLAVLTGLLGVGVAGVQTVRKRSADAEKADAQAEAEAATKEAQAHAAKAEDLETSIRGIVNGIDLLRIKNPAVADAMKAAKGDFLQNVTDTAKAIIKDERLT